MNHDYLTYTGPIPTSNTTKISLRTSKKVLPPPNSSNFETKTSTSNQTMNRSLTSVSFSNKNIKNGDQSVLSKNGQRQHQSQYFVEDSSNRYSDMIQTANSSFRANDEHTRQTFMKNKHLYQQKQPSLMHFPQSQFYNNMYNQPLIYNQDKLAHQKIQLRSSVNSPCFTTTRQNMPVSKISFSTPQVHQNTKSSMTIQTCTMLDSVRPQSHQKTNSSTSAFPVMDQILQSDQFSNKAFKSDQFSHKVFTRSNNPIKYERKQQKNVQSTSELLRKSYDPPNVQLKYIRSPLTANQAKTQKQVKNKKVQIKQFKDLKNDISINTSFISNNKNVFRKDQLNINNKIYIPYDKVQNKDYQRQTFDTSYMRLYNNTDNYIAELKYPQSTVLNQKSTFNSNKKLNEKPKFNNIKKQIPNFPSHRPILDKKQEQLIGDINPVIYVSSNRANAFSPINNDIQLYQKTFLKTEPESVANSEKSRQKKSIKKMLVSQSKWPAHSNNDVLYSLNYKDLKGKIQSHQQKTQTNVIQSLTKNHLTKIFCSTFKIGENEKGCACMPKCFWVDKWLQAAFSHGKRRQKSLHLIKSASNQDQKQFVSTLKQIQKDIPRTFSSHPTFLCGRYQQYLRSLLVQVYHMNPSLGYVQGMNVICASMLYHTKSQNQSLQLVDFVMNVLEYRMLFEDNFNKCKILASKVHGFIRQYSFDLFNHLQENDVDIEIFVVGWLLAMLGTFVPLQQMHWIIDSFVERGFSGIVSVLITFFIYLKQQIMKKDDGNQIMQEIATQKMIERGLTIDWSEIVMVSRQLKISIQL